jgi:hypothetical protein
VLLICGRDCSAYLWPSDGFAEFSKKLRQTPSPAGPRAGGAPASKAWLQLPATRPRSRITASSHCWTPNMAIGDGDQTVRERLVIEQIGFNALAP